MIVLLGWAAIIVPTCVPARYLGLIAVGQGPLLVWISLIDSYDYESLLSSPACLGV